MAVSPPPLERLALTEALVRLCERPEHDPGPEPGFPQFSDEDYLDAASDLLRQIGNQPIQVFAYGSLLWKPAADAIETRRARLDGFRRSFCLEIKRWRGSAAQPGLMMGLKRGGACEGAVLRFPGENRHGELVRLLRREVDCQDDFDTIQFIQAATAEGAVPAIAFWAEPEGCRYFVDHGPAGTARILARACGHLGSGAAYLYETVRKLDELGIHDTHLWDLQQRVAEEIVARKSVV
jgi:glutathione-specific gamma-glutamylcyclotransferase